MDVEEGYRQEEAAIGELLPGNEAQAAIYAFGLVERRAKRAEPARSRGPCARSALSAQG